MKARNTMADKKWKLGDSEFDTEEEYLDASKDLMKIKHFMEKYDTNTVDGARAVLKEVENKPVFTSSYGMKFIEKLEKTAKGASASEKLVDDAMSVMNKGAGAAGQESTKKGKKAKKEKKSQKKPKKEKKVHIITRRNILIGAVIIAVLVLAKVFVPGFLVKKENTESIHRNLVLAYAKNQVELQNSFYNYYKNVQGEESEAAKAAANDILAGAYTIVLTDEDVANYSEKQIEEIYVKLLTAGEIENNGFNEPQAITDMKQTVALSASAGQPGNNAADTMPGGNASGEAAGGTQEAATKVSLINRMMDYQQRVASQLSYNYEQLDFSEAEVKEYVTEDMEKIFGQIVYDMELSDNEKELYYNSFLQTGFFNGTTLVRPGTNPVEYNLPELTPSIKIVGEDGKETEVSCSQQTVVPVASVAYELHAGNKTGYLMFRGNSTGIDFVQDDDGNSVITQGDYFLKWDGEIHTGEWYYNSIKIGFLVNGQRSGGIQYVYDLKY